MTVDPGVPRKLGFTAGMRVLLVAPPDGYREGLAAAEPGLALEVSSVATGVVAGGGGPFDAMQVFCIDRSALERLAPMALAAFRPGARLWVCYPKGGSGVATDLGRDVDWTPLREAGFRPVTQVAVDAVWSGLRFRPLDEVGR